LRVGEFTSPSKTRDSSRALAIEDIRVLGSNRKWLEVIIRYSKTDQRGSSAKLQIESSANIFLCPVRAMESYLQGRPVKAGLLFIHFDKSPLTTSQFNGLLKKGIKAIGLISNIF